MTRVTDPAPPSPPPRPRGQGIYFSTLREQPYVLTYGPVFAPPTEAQVARRACFHFLTTEWHNLGTFLQATWGQLVPALYRSNYTAYLAENLKRWQLNQGLTTSWPPGPDGPDIPTSPYGELTPIGHVLNFDGPPPGSGNYWAHYTAFTKTPAPAPNQFTTSIITDYVHFIQFPRIKWLASSPGTWYAIFRASTLNGGLFQTSNFVQAEVT